MGEVAGAVLTGGHSRRMGQDKALLPWRGRPMACWAADALRAAGASPVLAIGGDLEGLRAAGLDAVPDPHQGTGPLGGIATALGAMPAPVVVVVACDMPNLTAAGLRTVVDRLGGHDVAVPVIGGRLEPLHSAWRATVLPTIEAALDAGERAVHAVLARLDVVTVEGLDPAWFHNVNSPADLGQTEQT